MTPTGNLLLPMNKARSQRHQRRPRLRQRHVREAVPAVSARCAARALVCSFWAGVSCNTVCTANSLACDLAALQYEYEALSGIYGGGGCAGDEGGETAQLQLLVPTQAQHAMQELRSRPIGLATCSGQSYCPQYEVVLLACVEALAFGGAPRQ